MTDKDFSAWLNGELARRGMKPFHLAQASGLNAATIQHLVNGTRQLGPDAARAIASALELPQETVFRAGGLLTEAPVVAGQGVSEELLAGFKDLEGLDPEALKEAREIIRIIRNRRKGGGLPGPNAPRVRKAEKLSTRTLA
jgi:transcriptional regulator with XRE-family HTH domain